MTAPHGPSEKVRTAAVATIWRHLQQTGLNLVEVHRAVESAIPAIVAEVRAAVVAECAHVLKAESDRRFRERTTDDSLGRAFDGGIAGAADILLGIEKARALLPPVSAPGPTLPRTPSGWDGPTMREFVRGREWSCVQAETGDVITLDDRGLVTLYGFDGTPLSDLQALLAALASRAERGPDAGGVG